MSDFDSVTCLTVSSARKHKECHRLFQTVTISGSVKILTVLFVLFQLLLVKL